MKKLIRSKWIILIILTVLWVTMTIIYSIFFLSIPANESKPYEIAKFIALSISAFGVLFSTLLSSFNSLESSQNNVERIEFDRSENSFAYIEKWDSSSLKDARDMTRKIKKEQNKLSPEELCKRIEGPFETQEEIKDQENLKRSVITMFNFFEGIYLAIEKNRVDASVLSRAFGSTYCNIFERFKPWIEKYGHKMQVESLKKLYTMWTD